MKSSGSSWASLEGPATCWASFVRGSSYKPLSSLTGHPPMPRFLGTAFREVQELLLPEQDGQDQLRRMLEREV
jgi:hypothetical protein